jgi:predicted RNA-binding Zn ribbon-like protein
MCQMTFAHYGIEIPFDALAQNLVNSYDNTRTPPEYLQTTRDLAAFLAQHGLPAQRLSAADLEAARLLRSRARGVFEANSARQVVRLVNALAASARLGFQVESRRQSVAVQWHVDEAANFIDRLQSALAINLATLLERFGVERLRVCETPPCRDVFIDVSKNGARRYCGTTCANRRRVAIFRQRHHDEG